MLKGNIDTYFCLPYKLFQVPNAKLWLNIKKIWKLSKRNKIIYYLLLQNTDKIQLFNKESLEL